MKLSSYIEDTGDDLVVHWGKILGFVVIVILVLTAIQFAVWGLGIVTAPWAGRQNVHRIINKPNNIIAVNNSFFTLNGDIATDAQNLKTAAAQADAHRKATADKPDPTGAIEQEQADLDTTVTGLSAHCAGLVQQYNNDAVNYTKAAFLSSNLPATQDPTQCEVSGK